MRVLVAGASGLIGTALVQHLRESGHDVVRLVRRAPRSAGEVEWDPVAGRLDTRAVAASDAVVDLAGVPVATRPLTAARKREVLVSRVQTAGLLSRTLADLAPRDDAPRVLLQASGIGAYGDRGDTLLDEHEPLGDTFFAGVVHRWEAATAPAEDAGVRVVHLRTGIVLSAHGGAAAPLLLPLRLGVAPRLGSGRQYWSWISLLDEVRAITHLLTADVHGPANLVARADRHGELVQALRTAWHAPLTVPAPAPLLRVALRDFASEVLGSVNADPAALRASGFVPRHATVTDVAQWLRATRRPAP
ncbi:NAD-dependent epimerase/dehydratase [Cellulomonas flavigena DSM 20109]|uniref:NAD-dependent epimerase/dehydratase n=1 Tax=Cellulomonas flavigena (strain ATCC 482 / DSM 20109 / BCRC 11376 / JCM 18109 / NBRC 3775 / NCIMB 8073 / NRS 134) TaxID=446466 RepID=D5UFX4_CELFN|nr:TIGR01777 family oxidoreductase [Cellulomonas flavigena]ADG74997.1 NAD-dependent epimerase/dehydratase [Cellulomonas flavigena DSM 20109]